MKQTVQIEYIRDFMKIPATGVPYPKPLRDVNTIILNPFTTEGSDARREFAMVRKSKPVKEGASTRCGICRRILDARALPAWRFCPNCGAMLDW